MTARALVLSLLLSLLLASSTSAAPEGVAPRLAAAEAAALRGEIDAAAAAYQTLLEEGLEGARLRYNLGTLRLQQGAIGPAVLHLRTALKLDPHLEDGAHNLEVALAAREDRVLDADLAPRATARLAALLPPRAAALALLALAFLLALCVGSLSWWPPGAPRRRVGLLSAALGASVLAVGAVVLAQALVRGEREAVVLATEAVARVAPSQAAAPSFTAHEGLFGVVVEEEMGFVRLRLDNGLDAWLPEEALAFTGERPTPGGVEATRRGQL